MAKQSDVETFCALRLHTDSLRWDGVPWYLRSGKYLAETAAEVIVHLKPPSPSPCASSAQAARSSMRWCRATGAIADTRLPQ